MDNKKLRSVKRAEAEGLLEAWRASGEGMKAWCGARGLNWFSLNGYLGWTRRAAALGRPELPALVELALPARTGPASEAVYRVDVGGLVLEVGERFDDETVRRLVMVLASC